jgi:anti-anti-sigma factor
MGDVSVFDDIEIDYLKIARQDSPNIPKGIRLVLTGEVNTNNTYQFQRKIEAIIDAGYIKILFECSGLNYLSSTGVGSFVSIFKKLNDLDGKMVLYQLPTRVFEVFQLLGFSNFIKCESTDLAKAEFFLLNQKSPPPIPSPPAQPQGSPLSHVSLFPMAFKCPKCGKPLKTSKSGRFRCPGCQSIIKVDAQGLISLE